VAGRMTGLALQLSKRWSHQYRLELQLELGRGTLVVAGESGSGKSTLLRLLAGLETPDAGRITVAGRVWFDHAAGIALPVSQRRVGWVPQDLGLFPHLTARENVAFGLRARGRRGPGVDRAVSGALERLGVVELADREPRALSGGQQQRVALARALVTEPDLLLLDEPLAALDVRTRESVRGELRRLLEGLACLTVFVTHSPVEAILFGDQVAVLEEGALVQTGNREELLRRPRSPYVAQFMGINLFRGRVIERRPDGGAVIATADGAVTVASGEAATAGEVFVAVSPREVTLYRTAPDASARNLFVGRVTEMIPEPPFGERVRVVLDTHPRLVAEVTRAAVTELRLAEGDEVFASFKATGAVAYA